MPSVDELTKLASSIIEARSNFDRDASHVLRDSVQQALQSLARVLNSVTPGHVESDRVMLAHDVEPTHGDDVVNEDGQHVADGDYLGATITSAALGKVAFVDPASVAFTKDRIACRVVVARAAKGDTQKFELGELTDELVHKLVLEELEAALRRVAPES